MQSNDKVFEWISVEDRLPDKNEYDWVLVAVMLVPEGWYGVPHIAELRGGVWYSGGPSNYLPLEESAGVKVTHWGPLPKNPEIDKGCHVCTTWMG